MSLTCDHLYTIDLSLSPELLLHKSKESCNWCESSGPNLWLCLFSGCLKVGCSGAHGNHSHSHNVDVPSHCVFVNLTDYRFWCHMCNMEFTSKSIGSLDINPTEQYHMGNLINAADVVVAKPVLPTDSSGDEEDDEMSSAEEFKPKGLVGLRNLGLTCYMNAALQALNNSLPLASFMRDCSAAVRIEKKQAGLVRPFYKLIQEVWDKKRPSYVYPTFLYQNFRMLYPMFRPYTQQDSQEFLRYFMDQLHEELKQPYQPLVTNVELSEDEEDELSSIESVSMCGGSPSPPDASDSSTSDADEYESCESEHSGGLSFSPQVKQKKRKRSRFSTFGSNKWMSVGLYNVEQEHSEFSDATSDTSLVERVNLRSAVKSSSTSGLGSSKPSMSSLSSNKGKWISHNKQGKAGNVVGNKSSIFPSSVPRKKKVTRYRSIISDIFDGVLVSSVQCLTCNTVSARRETFQDLSLPIPSSEQLGLLEHNTLQPQTMHIPNQSMYMPRNSCDVTSEGWIWLWMRWIWLWMRSWIWGPAVSLMHCLAAFSSDELKGENMYSCEKCSKLRNGVKFSKFSQLPESLIIHLKRFRHEYLFSSKINQYVSFPLQDLDLTPFLHKDCISKIRTYDLYAVICHHGAVGSGHYTAYAQNICNGNWYEFDDQYVTEVTPETVANCEAYVLFYKKDNTDMVNRRQRTVELMQVSSFEPSLMQFYVSKEWINKFNTFAEPGPIDNSDFLCPHGGVQPLKSDYVTELVMLLNQGVWEYLHQAFGGGPACTRLYECVTCREELEALDHRQTEECQTFIELHKRFQKEKPCVVYAIAMRWFLQWDTFVRGRTQDPPGPVDNSTICTHKYNQTILKQSSDYAPISEAIWIFFQDIYGGGPELMIQRGSPKTEEYEHPQNDEGFDSSEASYSGGKEAPFDAGLTVRNRSLSTDDLPFRNPYSSIEDSPVRMRQRTVSDGEVSNFNNVLLAGEFQAVAMFGFL